MMAGRPAPRPKGKHASRPKGGQHTTQAGRDYRRVSESKKWNNGTVLP